MLFPSEGYKAYAFALTMSYVCPVTSRMLAAGINSTVVAGENLTVGSTVWLPAESVAPGR
jgi:hypothetical protein